MTVIFHPKFTAEVVEYAVPYTEISERLGARFKQEIIEAIAAIKMAPTSAGHFLNTGSVIISEVRRRNLPSFKYFILYGVHQDLLVFGALIPSASDPQGWLERLDVFAS